jgi:hypothetical protein
MPVQPWATSSKWSRRIRRATPSRALQTIRTLRNANSERVNCRIGIIKGGRMASCSYRKCIHCGIVSAMLDRENEDHLTSDEIVEAAAEAGVTPGSVLPNDHSRPALSGDWCTIPRSDTCAHDAYAPNRMPWCEAHCWHGNNIFWSWIECRRQCDFCAEGEQCLHGISCDCHKTHSHTRPNRYKVADVLYWCDGSRASA